jgi:hypothetical protein
MLPESTPRPALPVLKRLISNAGVPEAFVAAGLDS